MLLYKYRGGDNKTFKRDLKSIEKNYFWSSSIDGLNDPCETMISYDNFIDDVKLMTEYSNDSVKKNSEEVLSSLEDFISYRKKIGIFSLSKKYDDELLWAHYANSHKGFCIEYDLEILLKLFKVENIHLYPVVYDKKVPEITKKDMPPINNELIKKLTSHKSLRWDYENEFRIITNSFGNYLYDYKALKSIYFGLRMNDKQKDIIFKTLKDRDIIFYEIKQIDKTYKFERKQIFNPYFVLDTYMKFIPSKINNGHSVNFTIREKTFGEIPKIGIIRIELENEISNNSIKWFTKFVNDEVFHNAKQVYVYFYLKNQKQDWVWATSENIEGKFKMSFNNF